MIDLRGLLILFSFCLINQSEGYSKSIRGHADLRWIATSAGVPGEVSRRAQQTETQAYVPEWFRLIEEQVAFSVAVALVILLLVLVVLLIRIQLQRTRVTRDLRRRIDERTIDLLHIERRFAQRNQANHILSANVARKLTAIAATLNGIQHLESVDRTEISPHLAILVDDIREVTRMIHKDRETPTV